MNRVKTLEVTKSYVEAFNRRDMNGLESLFDKEIVFARQSQPTIVGAEPIIRRTLKTMDRLDRQGHQLHMINGIIDFKGTNAHPCMIGIMDGEKSSVVVLDCKNNGLITSISILLTMDMVEKARPTEPLAAQEIAELHSMKPEFSQEELDERREGLREKAKKLKQRFEEEGPTQLLLGKLERLQEAQKKLKIIEEDLKLRS